MYFIPSWQKKVGKVAYVVNNFHHFLSIPIYICNLSGKLFRNLYYFSVISNYKFSKSLLHPIAFIYEDIEEEEENFFRICFHITKMFSNKVDSIQLPLSFDGKYIKWAFNTDVCKMIDVCFESFFCEVVVFTLHIWMLLLLLWWRYFWPPPGRLYVVWNL